jgi:hypothetical protein
MHKSIDLVFTVSAYIYIYIYIYMFKVRKLRQPSACAGRQVSIRQAGPLELNHRSCP